MSALSRRVAATALLACLSATSTPLAADGPRNRVQVRQANTLRNQLQRPLNRLYTEALRRCSGSSDEGNLVREVGRLCGAAYAFGLIVIDERHYLTDRRFKLHVDRAFEEVRDATTTVDAVAKRIAEPVWRPLAPSWKAYHERFTRLADLWSGEVDTKAKLQAIHVTADSTKVATGTAATLAVVARYSDGTTKPATTNVAWLVMPDNGEVTIDSARRFVAKKSGVYLVMAVYGELQSAPVVMRVTRPRLRLEKHELTSALVSDRDPERVTLQSARCRLPDEAFRAVKIRVLERPARIGDVRVTFADGSTERYWEEAKTLAPGEHLLARFDAARKIVRFDLRSLDAEGRSRQVLVGQQWRRGAKPAEVEAPRPDGGDRR